MLATTCPARAFNWLHLACPGASLALVLIAVVPMASARPGVRGAGEQSPVQFTAEGTEDRQFGLSIAGDAETVVVGSVGGVHVFVRPEGGWTSTSTPAAKLVASDGQPFDDFGISVALDGDTVVVGASTADAAGALDDLGAAYVFTRPAGGWSGTLTESAKLTALDAMALGASVSIDGDTILAGAPRTDVDVLDDAQGAAYVFIRPAAGWTTTSSPAAKLVASDGLGGESFGLSVALKDGTAVAGAPADSVDFNLWPRLRVRLRQACERLERHTVRVGQAHCFGRRSRRASGSVSGNQRGCGRVRSLPGACRQ